MNSKVSKYLIRIVLILLGLSVIGVTDALLARRHVSKNASQ